MNNLTPLQEIASRIYAAKIASGVFNNPLDSFTQSEKLTYKSDSLNQMWLINDCITEAKALLEATKPEPLEWNKTDVKQYTKPAYYSDTNEFEIAETNGGEFVVYKIEDLNTGLAYFPTLNEAKQFAEHIRTR